MVPKGRGAWGVGRGAWGVGRGAWGVGRGAWGACFPGAYKCVLAAATVSSLLNSSY